jgi:AMP-binding enzyme C-terminal domain
LQGQIRGELDRLRDNGLVRVIDALAVHQDADGDVKTLDDSQLSDDEQAAFGALAGAVPDDPGQPGHERVHRHRGQGRRHHGDRHPDRHHPLYPGDGDVHGDRRQGRLDPGAPAGLRHRLALVAELQEHCRTVTAPYKYPREIEFTVELPETISGKIRRVELREREPGGSS